MSPDKRGCRYLQIGTPLRPWTPISMIGFQKLFTVGVRNQELIDWRQVSGLQELKREIEETLCLSTAYALPPNDGT